MIFNSYSANSSRTCADSTLKVIYADSVLLCTQALDKNNFQIYLYLINTEYNFKMFYRFEIDIFTRTVLYTPKTHAVTELSSRRIV